MGQLIMTMWMTLDGFVAGPNNEMDWVVPLGEHQSALVSTADTLVLGRVTYQSFAGAWPYVPEQADAPEELKAYARKLNSMRKIVFSTTLDAVEWQNSTLKREIVPAEIEQLKRESDTNIIIYGSASVVQQLMNLGLIDEYHVLLHPLVLGSGKPLFSNIAEKTGLRLRAAIPDPSGVVHLTYERQT
jgi:dihydrofolate reductase